MTRPPSFQWHLLLYSSNKQTCAMYSPSSADAAAAYSLSTCWHCYIIMLVALMNDEQTHKIQARRRRRTFCAVMSFPKKSPLTACWSQWANTVRARGISSLKPPLFFSSFLLENNKKLMSYRPPPLACTDDGVALVVSRPRSACASFTVITVRDGGYTALGCRIQQNRTER